MTRSVRRQPRSVPPSGQTGAALLMTLLVMAITLAMGIGLLTATVTDLQISANFRSRATAFYAADSGIEQTVADLRSDLSWIGALYVPGEWSARVPAPNEIQINGHVLSLTLDADGNVLAGDYPFGDAETVGQATYSRTLAFPAMMQAGGGEAIIGFSVRSTGFGGIAEPSSQTIRADVLLTVESHGVWDNAIFAGRGQAGNLINGNVAIRGSVHVIGDPDDPPNIEFSGTADIRNSYADAVSHFGAVDAARLPPLQTVEVNGIAVETLDTVVRLEHGTIVLDGSAEIGGTNDDSNGVKETIDAVRTNGVVGPDDAVHADDWDVYDADGARFPSLDDPYADPVTGTTWPHQRDYLDTSALTIDVDEISRDVDGFSFSDGNGNAITWDPDEGRLTIAGIVRVDGDLRLGKAHGKPGERGLSYSGSGTFYATGNIEIDGWLVPDGDYLDDGNLGLIAAEDILIDESSQINVMAAIYAEDTIRVTKQTNIAGALVGNYFDMGKNVPAVFHVPLLSSMLPPGMPGAGGIVVVDDARIANWYQETAR